MACFCCEESRLVLVLLERLSEGETDAMIGKWVGSAIGGTSRLEALCKPVLYSRILSPSGPLVTGSVTP